MDGGGLQVADYARQSAYSDPGCHGDLFDDVQPTIDSVSAMARNVVVHYNASGLSLPQRSRADVDLRWVEAILATDQQRHHAPLDGERPVESRVQGCCRDHSLLAVAALRHHNVPARTRVGFASYLLESWHHDHELLLWDRWGAMNPHQFDAPPQHVELVDEVATLLIGADQGDILAERELRARYRQDGRLRPGSFVHSISPTGDRHVVDLATRSTTRLG